MNLNTKKLMLTALTVTLLSSGGAFAQGNSGNARSNAMAGAQNGNSGAIASELKGLNAAHAAAQAFMNANSESIVGKLAIYKEATQAAMDAYEEAGIDPDTYEVRDIAEIEADILAVETLIAELDETSATYEADLIALLEELAALEAELELALILAEEEEAIQLIGADTLSDDALVALWEMLND